ncbi:MAG: hypothetical protein ACKOT0_08160 [bacterium]
MTRRLIAALASLAVALPLGLAASSASAAPDVSTSAHQVNWRAVPLSTPYPGYDNTALDVDCIGATCWILGLVGSEDSGRPYLTVLQGHTPTSAPLTDVDGTTAQALSCPEPDWCMIVGSVHTNAPSDRTWAALYADGVVTYLATPTPTNGMGGQGYLFDVSCTSTTWCAAVGHYFDPQGGVQGLMLQWNGRKWKRIETGPTAGRFLTGIDCVSQGHCVLTSSQGRLQLRQWTPRGWFRIAVAADARAMAATNLDCLTMNSCIVTGFDTSTNPEVGALLRTTGRESHRIALPSMPPTFIFKGVSCQHDGTCWAVGGADGKYARGAVAWISPTDKVRVTVPYIPQPYGTQLTGISCNARCVAIGQGVSADYTLVPYAILAR